MTPALPVRVLSVQTPIMGHGTYARMIRRYLAQTPLVEVESAWADTDKDLLDRLVNRALCLNPPGLWLARRNLDLRRFRTELGGGFVARRQALRCLRHRPCDVLHFHTQVSAYGALDLMRRIPTVLSGDMTSALVAREAQAAAPAWTYAPNIALEQRLYHAAAHVVLWSEWAARSVVDDYGIDPKKVSVIPPGVDRAAFAPPRPHAPHERVKILFVGNDFARKGGPDLLDVFGNGFADQAELHLVTNAPVDCASPHVHRHPNVAAYSAEWLALYQSADIFALPTRGEAFGLVFLEAMAAGLPVVGTHLNAIPEMVIDGETGLLAPPGDRLALARHLQALVDNAVLRREMGAKGRARAAAEFDAQTNFSRLEDVFVRVARKG